MRKKLISNVRRTITGFRPRKHYKDRLFQRVFQDKKDLLDLYNAINHTKYENPDELTVTTLEDVIYLSMKNDMSFMISNTLNLYEHQSSWNPNMPIRGLMYFAKLYEAYIKAENENVYGHALVKLPAPQYIVFYNGADNIPDRSELLLSDAFEPATTPEQAVLQCKTTVLNINYGHNATLLDSCKRLHDYAFFIAEVKQNISLKKLPREKAVAVAIDTCISQGILADILEKCRSEVSSMLLTEFDEKWYYNKVREEGEDRMASLTNLLIEANRIDDLTKVTNDKAYRQKLFEEFGL